LGEPLGKQAGRQTNRRNKLTGARQGACVRDMSGVLCDALWTTVHTAQAQCSEAQPQSSSLFGAKH